MRNLYSVLSFLLITSLITLGQVTQTTSFQGVLTDSEGAVIEDGDHSLNFKLYDSASNGTMLWEETQVVPTVGGILNVILGKVTILDLPFDEPYWIEMSIDGGEALSPRVELTSSVYSLMSKSVEDSTISTAKLQDGAVTQEKLSGLVSLPPGGTAGGDLVGNYPNPSIAENAVNSAKVADNTITSDDIATSLISSIDGVSNDGGNVDLVEGSNITITSNDGANTITIAATPGSGDNLGNHTASQNIKLNNKWLSNDGGDEGIKIDNSGKVQTNSDLTVGDNIVAKGYVISNDFIKATNSSTANNINALYGIISSTSPGLNSASVRGENKGTGGIGIGVYGSQDGSGWGVFGKATSGRGVYGKSTSGYGVYGSASGIDGQGVHGWATNSGNVTNYGGRFSADGVHGRGVSGKAQGTFGTGVSGLATGISGTGVFGNASGTSGIGVYGYSPGYAGKFDGNVKVTGTLSKGGGSFQIDHPLDPQNKNLYHSFVESPDMMNIYNGNVTTDGNGNANIELPEWFGALNKDFRYQLTVIGEFAQAIVSEEINNNRFSIKTDKPNVKVSWLVTGIRQDAFANANRILVEEMKKPEDRGKYLHPKAFGMPVTMGVDYDERFEQERVLMEEQEAEMEKMRKEEEQRFEEERTRIESRGF